MRMKTIVIFTCSFLLLVLLSSCGPYNPSNINSFAEKQDYAIHVSDWMESYTEILEDMESFGDIPEIIDEQTLEFFQNLQGSSYDLYLEAEKYNSQNAEIMQAHGLFCDMLKNFYLATDYLHSALLVYDNANLTEDLIVKTKDALIQRDLSFADFSSVLERLKD